VIIVFGGATGGLGSALVVRLWVPGKDVLAVGRRHCDIESEASVEAYWNDAPDWPDGPLHIINATGYNANATLAKMTWEDFDKVMRVNVGGAFLILKHAAPVLRERPGSTVTLFSSIVPRLGVIGTSAYSASKSALIGLVKTASLEFARFGVRVNLIELGYFDYGMIKQVPEAMRDELVAKTPLRRLGTIDDLGHACEFLMRCEFITGATIRLNGGLA